MPQKGRRRAVAQHGALDGQDRGEPPAVPAEQRMADGVDAAMDPVEAPLLEAVADGPAAQAELEELAARDDAVLAGGEGGDRGVDGTWPTFGPHVEPNVDFVGRRSTGALHAAARATLCPHSGPKVAVVAHGAIVAKHL